MFKKLVILLALSGLGAWAAGVDFAQLKAELLGASNSNAGDLTGTSQMQDSDWG